MPDERLSFTMQATVGQVPPDPHGADLHGDGPPPYGWARIPVTMQVLLPPEVTGSAGPGARGPEPVRPGSMPVPSRTVQPMRATGRFRPLPRGEAGRRVLESLSIGPGSTGMPGGGPGTGVPGGELRPGELMAVLRAISGTVPPVPAAGPEGPDPGFEAFLAAGHPGAARRRIAGLPAVVLRSPGPVKVAPPPAPGGGSGTAAGANRWTAAAEIGLGGVTAIAGTTAAAVGAVTAPEGFGIPVTASG